MAGVVTRVTWRPGRAWLSPTSKWAQIEHCLKPSTSGIDVLLHRPIHVSNQDRGLMILASPARESSIVRARV